MFVAIPFLLGGLDFNSAVLSLSELEEPEDDEELDDPPELDDALELDSLPSLPPFSLLGGSSLFFLDA